MAEALINLPISMITEPIQLAVITFVVSKTDTLLSFSGVEITQCDPLDKGDSKIEIQLSPGISGRPDTVRTKFESTHFKFEM